MRDNAVGLSNMSTYSPSFDVCYKPDDAKAGSSGSGSAVTAVLSDECSGREVAAKRVPHYVSTTINAALAPVRYWRIRIDSVAGGGTEVETTEAAFVDETFNYYDVSTATANSMTAGSCPATCGLGCEQSGTAEDALPCQYNGDTTDDDRATLSPLPAYYNYVLTSVAVPSYIALADAESTLGAKGGRFPQTLTPQYSSDGDTWIDCAPITTADGHAGLGGPAYLPLLCDSASAALDKLDLWPVRRGVLM